MSSLTWLDSASKIRFEFAAELGCTDPSSLLFEVDVFGTVWSIYELFDFNPDIDDVFAVLLPPLFYRGEIQLLALCFYKVLLDVPVKVGVTT